VTARHWSDREDCDPARFHGLKVLAADGFAIRTPDTASNRAEFGKPSSRRGYAAFPVVQAVGLVQTATHLAIDVELGGASQGELGLFELIIDRIPEGTVTILDRNYDSVWHMWRVGDAARERHWLVRSKGRVKAKVLVEHSVGDELVEVAVSREARRKHPELPASLTMRRIRYTAGHTQVTVLTSMLDPQRFPAEDVARLYHQRWEVENGQPQCLHMNVVGSLNCAGVVESRPAARTAA
jgi:hypothetical protein